MDQSKINRYVNSMPIRLQHVIENERRMVAFDEKVGVDAIEE